MPTSIVIPTFVPKHLDTKIDTFIRPGLDAFLRYTIPANIDLIYVVNGSIEAIRDVIRPPAKIDWHTEALGFTKAANRGLQLAQSDFILLWNDDAILLTQPKNFWLDELLAPMRDPSVGITGVHELFSPDARANFLIGYCLMLRRTMLEQIGLLDEVFSPGSGEDIDICMRARSHKWKTRLVHFPIYHKAEASFHNWESVNDFANGQSKWQQIFDRNMDIVAKRQASGFYSKPTPILETIPRLQEKLRQ